MKADNLFEMGLLKNPLKTPYLYRRLTISADGRYLAVTGRQETENAFVWEIATRKLIRPPLMGVNFLRFVGKSHILMGSQAKMWDVEQNVAANPPAITPAPEKCPDGQIRTPYFDFCMSIDPAGEQILGASLFDGDYYYSDLGLWKIQTGQAVRRYKTPRVKYNNARVRFGGDGSWFIFAAQLEQHDTALHVSTWDIGKPDGPVLVQQLELGRDDFNFELSPDGQLLAAADKFYELSKEGGAQLIQNEFLDDAERRMSQRLLPGRLLMELNRQGELLVHDLEGNQKALLELDYTTTVKGQTVIQKLNPRMFVTSANYYLAADDNVVLLWSIK